MAAEAGTIQVVDETRARAATPRKVEDMAKRKEGGLVVVGEKEGEEAVVLTSNSAPRPPCFWLRSLLFSHGFIRKLILR